MLSFNQYITEGLYPEESSSKEDKEDRTKKLLKYALGGLGAAVGAGGLAAGGYYAYNQNRWDNAIDKWTNHFDVNDRYQREFRHFKRHHLNTLKDEYPWTNPEDREELLAKLREDPERRLKAAFKALKSYEPLDRSLTQEFTVSDDGLVHHRLYQPSE